jgi:hypothetical protein
MDKFITKWKKEGDPTKTEYYGYEHTEVLRTDLAQNYLSNSDNFISSDSGWVFDGAPAKGNRVNGKEKIVGYTGQIFEFNNETDNNEQDSVLVLQLTNEEEKRMIQMMAESERKFFYYYRFKVWVRKIRKRLHI